MKSHGRYPNLYNYFPYSYKAVLMEGSNTKRPLQSSILSCQMRQFRHWLMRWLLNIHSFFTNLLNACFMKKIVLGTDTYDKSQMGLSQDFNIKYNKIEVKHVLIGWHLTRIIENVNIFYCMWTQHDIYARYIWPLYIQYDLTVIYSTYLNLRTRDWDQEKLTWILRNHPGVLTPITVRPITLPFRFAQL